MKSKSQISNLNVADLEAVTNLQAGNANAFAVIYKRYHAYIHNKAITMFNTEAEAEDAVQDVFIKVYQQLLDGKFQDKGFTFNSWITRVANNLLIDIIRVNKANPEKSKGISLDNISEDSFDMIESSLLEISKQVYYDDNESQVENERLTIMSKLIDKALNQREKDVLKLYVDGMKGSEIALQLGENHIKIRTMISRIKDKLSIIVSNTGTDKYKFA